MDTHQAQVAIRQMANIYRVLKDAEEVLGVLGKAAGASAELEEAIAGQRETLEQAKGQHAAIIHAFEAKREAMQQESDVLTVKLVAQRDEHDRAEAEHAKKLMEGTDVALAAREIALRELHATEDGLRNDISELTTRRDAIEAELAELRAKFG